MFIFIFTFLTCLLYANCISYFIKLSLGLPNLSQFTLSISSKIFFLNFKMSFLNIDTASSFDLHSFGSSLNMAFLSFISFFILEEIFLKVFIKLFCCIFVKYFINFFVPLFKSGYSFIFGILLIISSSFFSISSYDKSLYSPHLLTIILVDVLNSNFFISFI